MFGNESKPARIYAYKGREPLGGCDAFGAQLQLAHRYANALIELERGRRELANDAVRRFAPAVLELEIAVAEASAGIEEAEAVIKGRNAAERSKTATAAEKVALAALRRRRKTLRDDHKEARREAFASPGLVSSLAAIEAAHSVSARALRAEYSGNGLYWGTYLLVEQSRKADRKGAPPRFRRWTGEGAIAVQLQGGLDWEAALACGDTRLRIQVLPPGPDADPDSARSREKCRAVAWLRAGSDPDDRRKPIWIRVPIRLHRRPPEGARIKWAYLHRTFIGRRPHWEVQFVLERESWDRDDIARDGRAGIDVNWRVTPAGLRVASVVGDDDETMTLTIPRDWLTAWDKSASLQSIRDRAFDAMRGRLSAWLAARKAVAPLPEWAAERLAHLGLWKSSDRLAAAVWRWRSDRFEGDEGIFDELEAWRKQDRHLHDWQDSQLRKAIRRRDDLYRKFALAVARRHRTLLIEDLNWREALAVPGPDEPTDAAIRANARIGAVGRLLQFLKEYAGEVIRVDARDTTRACALCGTIDEWDPARTLAHRCSACGQEWDQDENAARNLLLRGAAAAVDAGAEAAA